ncbi:carboxylesterase family protein [Frondihabitans cladoniiphilus]|uniref:Carboxylesterase family protein n=1 Tax=Frondihabitans cladoniiphilus TaxID=715785 RepID=A0ABP8VPU7_9MICO
MTATAPAETRRFETPVGEIVGYVDGDVVRMLGVPYARAGRFEVPRPVHPTLSPFQAFQRGPASPQSVTPILEQLVEGGSDGMTASEDCQNLSITLPADIAPEERLPVMVWIHGGAYVTGAGDLDVYDPRDLVVEQRVVVVNVTFRLGLLGFFGDGATIPANLGLLDLIEALRWLHANVESVGGAADQVTLFGQSAGGDAIAHLMISEGARGLFRRAIIESAPLGISAGRSAMVRAMVAAVSGGSPDGLASLRDAPVDDLLARQGVAERAALRGGLRAGMAFGTQYGFAPLPAEGEREEAWRDVAPDVDVLIGSTVDETGLYLPFVPVLRSMVRMPRLGSSIRAAIVRPSTWVTYKRDVARFAARHRAAGGTALTYELSWAPRGLTTGSVHMSELPLLLGTRRAWEKTSFVGRTPWSEIAERGPVLRAAWASFARTGAIDEALEQKLAGTVALGR